MEKKELEKMVPLEVVSSEPLEKEESSDFLIDTNQWVQMVTDIEKMNPLQQENQQPIETDHQEDLLQNQQEETTKIPVVTTQPKEQTEPTQQEELPIDRLQQQLRQKKRENDMSKRTNKKSYSWVMELILLAAQLVLYAILIMGNFDTMMKIVIFALSMLMAIINLMVIFNSKS